MERRNDISNLLAIQVRYTIFHHGCSKKQTMEYNHKWNTLQIVAQ